MARVAKKNIITPKKRRRLSAPVVKRRYGPKPGSHHLDRRAHLLLGSELLANAPDDYPLTTRQVAEILGMSEQWLETGRCRKYRYGPPFRPVGKRAIRYFMGEFREWLRSRPSYRSTAEYPKEE
jgi:hypothetical protein